MNFNNDNSTQLNITTSSYLPSYSSTTNPSILFNDGTSGIYNATANSIIMYTSGTTALTIDSNQCLYGNGTGLTHIQYSNIDNKPTNFQCDYNSTLINKPSTFPGDYNNLINKPTNFQSDYNSTVINTPNLSVYATNTNLNNLSSQSYLDIPNIKTTSTTILTNLNSVSTNSTLSINNLNATSTTIFTNLNSLSTNSILSINNLNATMNSIFSISSTHQLAINNLNATSTTIFTNLNSLSTNSALSINNLNATMNNIFSISSTHQLAINNLNATSTTIFTNLNSLSTNSTLSINNINATSTTIFTNLNSLSTNSILSINNLNATSTTLLTNINSLSTNSILSINNINATSTTILGLVNGHTTSIANLNATSTTLLTNINNLNSTSTTILGLVNGHTTSISNLNATSTTLLSNINTISSNTSLITQSYISIAGTNPYYSLGNGSLLGYYNTTIISGPNPLSSSAIIGDSILRAAYNSRLLLQSGTMNTAFYIDSSNNVVSNSPFTCLSSLNVSGTATLNNTTIKGVISFPSNQWITDSNTNVYVNQRIYFDNGAKTYFRSGGTSTTPLLDGFIFRNGQAGTDLLNIDGSGNSTQLGSLLVGGASTYVSSLNVSGNTTLNNATTCNSSLNVSGNITSLSSLNVSGTANLGPLFINNSTTNNTFFQIGTTGNILTIRGSAFSWLGCSEYTYDSHIALYSGQGANYRCCPSSGHILGDTSGNSFMSLTQASNYSNSPFTFANAVSCNSSLNVAGNINIGGSIGGNLNIGGFLTCGNRWATFSLNISLVSGTTYCAGFVFNNYPNLVNGKTFLIDCAITQAGLPTSTSYGFTQVINNPGTTSSGNVVTKNLYYSSNTASNWYNAYTSWNDALNVYTYGTSLPQLVCTLRLMVLG